MYHDGRDKHDSGIEARGGDAVNLRGYLYKRWGNEQLGFDRDFRVALSLVGLSKDSGVACLCRCAKGTSAR